mmetsp:Transcript_16801/g.30127  ORF Transcript_16801/g.30127 Transcript_16801/m.30127 type:complete len:372 (-) Transcript_16801:314-1429(-)|eukprot:CAMPEP_0197530926 /NCGR_PEP_ID=MMETSP1318-20131121/33447_1 /TAXON_ID=552666 /ORGANISM="Partenskyella glossopodia, Strain RCC365" /LENGTH=371 /DNA_ID=CAMNT_0043086945 /DNA_START=28 /DNA_END=1143 /DNA_ORIENTATION=-
MALKLALCVVAASAAFIPNLREGHMQSPALRSPVSRSMAHRRSSTTPRYLTKQYRHTRLRSRHVLTFTERESGKKVVLIGTMHYNPSSIETVRKVVSEVAAKSSNLSLVVELCPERFKAMREIPRKSVLGQLFDNEMLAAFEAARDAGVDNIVLGDCTDAELSSRIAAVAKSTGSDILNPFQGGWQAILRDFERLGSSMTGKPAFQSKTKKDNSRRIIQLEDLFEASLLMGAPLALIRNFVVLAVKLPSFIKATALVGLSFMLRQTFLSNALAERPHDESHAVAATTMHEHMVTANHLMWDPFTIAVLVALSVTNLAMYTAFARVAAVALLLERDEILAASIRDCCRQAGNRTVVAVLGMAHCNGVARLLR